MRPHSRQKVRHGGQADSPLMRGEDFSLSSNLKTKTVPLLGGLYRGSSQRCPEHAPFAEVAEYLQCNFSSFRVSHRFLRLARYFCILVRDEK